MTSKTPTKIVFSYSHDDEPYVFVLAKALQGKGIEVIRDVTSIDIGLDWLDVITTKISDANHLLWVISDTALKSENIKLEILYTQLTKPYENHPGFILPILIKPVTELPKWLTKYSYADFVNKPDQATTQLLRTLGLL